MTTDEAAKEIEEINLANQMSFASKVRLEAEKEANPSTKFDVESLSIYAGGSIFGPYSYFFEFYLHERGKETSSTGGQIDTATRSKLAEAYLQYTSKPFSDDYTFMRAGQYTPRIIYQASTGGRLSVSRPLLWNDNVGGGNLYTPRDRFMGVTAGINTADGILAEAGITNGGGGNSRPNQPEFNTAKDWFVSASKTLDENGSMVGAYYYQGYYPVTGTTPYTDDFTRYAILAEFNTGQVSVSGVYSAGTNHNSDGSTRNPNGYYLEVGYNVDDDSTVFGRYDKFDNDLAAEKSGFTVGFSKRLAQVGRIVIEYSSIKPVGGSAANKLTLELNWLL
jgi:hypothetical protein